MGEQLKKLNDLSEEDIYQLGVDDCKNRGYDEAMGGYTAYILRYGAEYARTTII